MSPLGFHDVTFSALAWLPDSLGRERGRGGQLKLSEVSTFEGVAMRVIGF